MTKTFAQQCADRLANLLGPGWKPVVWENIGWHFKASYGEYLHVYHSAGTKPQEMTYHVMIGESGCMLAMYSPDDKTTHDKDPRNAVRRTLGAYRHFVEEHYHDQAAMLQEAETCLAQWR